MMEEIITEGARRLAEGTFTFLDIVELNPSNQQLLERCLRSPVVRNAFISILRRGNFSIYEFVLGRRITSASRTATFGMKITTHREMSLMTPERHLLRHFYLHMSQYGDCYVLRSDLKENSFIPPLEGLDRKRICNQAFYGNEVPRKQKRYYKPKTAIYEKVRICRTGMAFIHVYQARRAAQLAERIVKTDDKASKEGEEEDEGDTVEEIESDDQGSVEKEQESETDTEEDFETDDEVNEEAEEESDTETVGDVETDDEASEEEEVGESEIEAVEVVERDADAIEDAEQEIETNTEEKFEADCVVDEEADEEGETGTDADFETDDEANDEEEEEEGEEEEEEERETKTVDDTEKDTDAIEDAAQENETEDEDEFEAVIEVNEEEVQENETEINEDVETEDKKTIASYFRDLLTRRRGSKKTKKATNKRWWHFVACH